MKPLVIYHANCADGFGAAFTAWLKFGNEAEYLPMQYNEYLPSEAFLKRDIYILDFSFERFIMDELFMTAENVVWLDHHKTAFQMWVGGKFDGTEGDHHQEDEVRYITLSQSKSSALLAWEYFHPGIDIPMFIKYIDDYDRWQFKIEGTKEFNKALWSYVPWSFEQWNHKFSNTYDFLDKQHLMRNEGEAILRAHEQNVQTVVEGATRACVIDLSETNYFDNQINVESACVIGLAANCPPHLASDVGHTLATQSGTYGLLWFVDKEGKCKCSLRSNGDYDVSAIAKSFGGGGHNNAAGFEIDIQILLEWIK